MKKKVLIFLLLLVIIISITGCSNECKRLAKKLDNKIVERPNPFGRFMIVGFEGVVGGTLIEINGGEYNDYLGYYDYWLVFKGKEKTGVFGLISRSNNISYKIGQFYKFDLSSRNKYSARLSGAFIDTNFTKLQPLNCD